LTYAGGAANHDDANYGTGFFYRGLVTSYTRYSFSTSPNVTNTVSYDMLGNPRSESADCCVQRQYNFSSTTQFAFPDSIVRGSGTTLTTSATYDGSTGLVATSTDENNKITSYSFDVMDRLTILTRPDNTQLTTSYDDASATASSTSTKPIEIGKSVKQKAEFDGLGRSIRAITMNASSIVYSKLDTLYDSVGRTWKVSNPYTGASPSYWTESQYDNLSRLTKTIPPDGSSFSNNISYSYSGNEAIVTDQSGKQRKTKTDALGRQIQVDEPDPNNGNSLTLATTYGYDPMDNLAQVNQGVQGRTNTYDGLSRLLSEATSEAGTSSYEYDNHSLLTRRTDARGVVTHYYYDPSLNRLTQMTYDTAGTSAAATSAVSFTYGTNPSLNNNGRLITESYGTYGADTESYTYDQLGRVTQVQKFFSSTYTTYNTNFTYNLASEVATITYPSSRYITNTYDAIGRPQGTYDNSGNIYVSNAQYNQANQVTSFSHGNGVNAFFGYSAQRLHLTSLRYTKGLNLLNFSYGYTQNGGNNGQITSITDSVQPGRSVTYTYDSLYRLKTALTTGSGQYPPWGLSWDHDRYGNATAQNVTAGSAPSYAVTLSPTTNHIIDPGFSYDASGNMTADGGQNWMVYDGENRMVSTTGGGGSASFTYDGNSLRLTKQSGGTTTTYLNSGQKVIAEYVNGSLSKEYVYLGGQLIATLQGGTPTYHLRDHLSIRVNTNSAGTVVGEQGHYPFGEQWYATGTPSNFIFTSYQRDPESGNDNAVFRQRSTRFGRFNMADPVRGSVANPQSLNRFAYTHNDPVNYVDPIGLLDCEFYVQQYEVYEEWLIPSGVTGYFCGGRGKAQGNAGGGPGSEGPRGGISPQRPQPPAPPQPQPPPQGPIMRAASQTQGPIMRAAPPPPSPQKVTASCMTAALIDNSVGSPGKTGVTGAVHVGLALGLGAGRRAVAALLPGPGWLYVGTAVLYDIAIVAKSYQDCRSGELPVVGGAPKP
jgi:RHS repeat-associated protein